MPFKIVRNDITKMGTEAIVNTANEYPAAGPGCDRAVYEAAGYEKLLAYRKEKIGYALEGSVFITPGFDLRAKYIIHAVSPYYINGSLGEEKLLRECYRKSLLLASEYGIRSIAFPLISTGGFGYPKEEGMRIAVDEIHAFLLSHDMMICLVVFDEKATQMGRNIYPDLEAYIDSHYVEEKREEEYGYAESASPDFYEDSEEESFPPENLSSEEHSIVFASRERRPENVPETAWESRPGERKSKERRPGKNFLGSARRETDIRPGSSQGGRESLYKPSYRLSEEDSLEELKRKLSERMSHIDDTFSEYLLYLIGKNGMKNSDVYNRAIVDKKVFSKIKNNPDYHPQKRTALCLCIGAKLNLDESRDLLARAGYALSPCDKTDIIFSYFIENEIYDMIELDIQLEEYGLPCIIS